MKIATLPTGEIAFDAGTEVRLFDASDVPWITIVVDHVMASLGQPWRVLRERLEHAPIRANRVAAILGALRRVSGGRADRIKIARSVRAAVLGHPVLDEDTRADRLAAAEAALGIPADELQSLLWIDLAEERPVTLPYGRPEELKLAAFANLDRIQHAIRRARHVRLRVWGNAHALIRTAARYGLHARVRVDRDLRGDATVLDLIGPLSLFHSTHVYGRALGSIAPLLADHARWDLAIECDFGFGPASLRTSSPALLPSVSIERGKPSIATRLAKALAKFLPDSPVERDPPPIVNGDDRLFPDIALEHAGARWWIDVVGFATADFIAAKHARYRDAGIANVILVVDGARAADDATDDSARANKIVSFRGRLPVADVVAIIEETP